MRRFLFSILFLLCLIPIYAQSSLTRMLVVTPDEFQNQLDTFIRFKQQQGMELQILPLSQAGTTALEVKQAIRQQYEENPFNYLFLIGDDYLFPVLHVGGYPADNDYAMMDNDEVPDVALGKLSVSSAEDLELQLTKIMTFEAGLQKPSYQYCNIAGNQSFDDVSDAFFLRSLDTIWKQCGMKVGFELFDGSQGGFDAPGNPSANDLLTIVNRGVDVVNYVGHGTAQTFSTTQFSVAHATQFTNTVHWPILFSLACETGRYEGATSLAESWMSASYLGQPAGAVAVLAAAAPIPWNAPKIAFRTLLEKLAQNPDDTSLGAAWLSALRTLSTSDSCEVMLHSWLLFGDPSMKLRLAVPNSVSSYSQNRLSIYPNPADNYVNIELYYDLPTDLTLFNSIGETVARFHATSTHTILFLGSLPDGCYLLKGNLFYQKLIIRHF